MSSDAIREVMPSKVDSSSRFKTPAKSDNIYFGLKYFFPHELVILSNRSHQQFQQILGRLDLEYSQYSPLALDPKCFFLRVRIFIRDKLQYSRFENIPELTMNKCKAICKLQSDRSVSSIRLVAVRFGSGSGSFCRTRTPRFRFDRFGSGSHLGAPRFERKTFFLMQYVVCM